MKVIPAKTEIITTEQIIAPAIFIANDGTKFRYEKDCLNYEEFLSLNTDIIDLLRPYVRFKKERTQKGEYGFNIKGNYCYLYKRVPEKIRNYCIALREVNKYFTENNYFIQRILSDKAEENMLYYLDRDMWLYQYKDNAIKVLKECQTELYMYDYFENKND